MKRPLLRFLVVIVTLLALAACAGNGVPFTPNPTNTPTTQQPYASPSPTRPPKQLAFLGSHGTIWLVNSDGTGRARFATDICNGGQVISSFDGGLAWSPGGDKLAFVCQPAVAAASQSLVVLDTDANKLLDLKRPGLTYNRIQWSPDGQRLAYGVTQNETGGHQVGVVNIETSEDEIVAEDGILLGWPVPDRILVGLNFQVGDLYVKYDAHWLDINSGAMVPLPRFNDGAIFWLAPGGQKAVVVTNFLDEQAGGFSLAINDLESGREQLIPGSAIGYPSETIPRRNLAISPDGKKLYWLNAFSDAVLYKANMDGAGLTRLGTIPDLLVTLSGDGLVAYRDFKKPLNSKDDILVIEDPEAATRFEISEDFAEMAWRPTP